MPEPVKARTDWSSFGFELQRAIEGSGCAGVLFGLTPRSQAQGAGLSVGAPPNAISEVGTDPALRPA